jgi:hypothetical protein
MSQGQCSAFQTAFLMVKDRLNVAKTVISVLPAFVKFTTDACLEEWFDDTQDHICATTTFMTDDNSNFNGKIRTATDEEALALLGKDYGFGVQAVEVEGMDLPEQMEATIPVAQPWDQVPTGAAKDPQDFGQHPQPPNARGDEDSSLASDCSHTQQKKGSVTTYVCGQPASPTGTGGLAV